MSDRKRVRSNPFEFGSELGADEIVNREDEIDEESLGLKQTKFDDPFFAAWIQMIT
jgi:hypothetical protein